MLFNEGKKLVIVEQQNLAGMLSAMCEIPRNKLTLISNNSLIVASSTFGLGNGFEIFKAKEMTIKIAYN